MSDEEEEKEEREGGQPEGEKIRSTFSQSVVQLQTTHKSTTQINQQTQTNNQISRELTSNEV